MKSSREILEGRYFVTQDMVLDHQRERYDRLREAGAGQAETDFVHKETTGGKCRCGTPWVNVVVKNEFADFEYYDPGCDCYGRCRVCKRSLHGVQIPMSTGRYKCPSCGYDTDGKLRAIGRGKKLTT